MDVAELSEKIADALNNAVSDQEFRTATSDHNGVVAAFLRGEISQKELETEEDFGDRPGVVMFDSLEEFTTALRMLRFGDDFIRATVSHEQAHFTVDQKNGFDPHYTIRFFINAEGKRSLIPSVNTKYPKGLSDRELRELIKKSIEAPEELSDSDQEKLQQGSNQVS